MTVSRPVLGIIGGTGWLGSALARRCLEAGVVAAEDLVVSSRSGPGGAFADWPAVRHVHENAALVAAADIIVLSVRPQDFPAIRIAAADRLVISVIAGIEAKAIKAATGASRVVRAMPNAAAEIGLSYSPWFSADPLALGDIDVVQRILESCGRADRVDDERQIDYLAGLSGTGPAYPALLAACLMRHALDHGIAPAIARRAVEGVICDASRLLADPAWDFEAVVERFRAYRGITAAGLDAMIERGFTDSVRAGLDAATSCKVVDGSP